MSWQQSIQVWWNFEDCQCYHKSHYCSLFWARSNELTYSQLMSFNIHFYIIIIMIMYVSQVGYFVWICKPVFYVWIFPMWLSCLPIFYHMCLAQTLMLLAMKISLFHRSLLNDIKNSEHLVDFLYFWYWVIFVLYLFKSHQSFIENNSDMFDNKWN